MVAEGIKVMGQGAGRLRQDIMERLVGLERTGDSTGPYEGGWEVKGDVCFGVGVYAAPVDKL